MFEKRKCDPHLRRVRVGSNDYRETRQQCPDDEREDIFLNPLGTGLLQGDFGGRPSHEDFGPLGFPGGDFLNSPGRESRIVAKCPRFGITRESLTHHGKRSQVVLPWRAVNRDGEDFARHRWTGDHLHFRRTPVAGESIRRVVWTRCVVALVGIAICLASQENSYCQTPTKAARQRLEWQARSTANAGLRNTASQQARANYEPGTSSTKLRKAALAKLPLQRLTPAAQRRILSIAEKPTIFRRLPTQAIDCDQDLYLFLSRNPEVLVGMWDLMGITDVQINRTGPYQLEANDGAGTLCTIDLVYGDPNVHVFIADGSYDGKLTPKPIRGHGVFMITSRYAKSSTGSTTVMGTIDCFLQIDSLGVDLIARTFSGLIGRAADNNFIETARFVTQVSQASEKNPRSMLDVADRLPQVPERTRDHFQTIIRQIADKAARRYASKPNHKKSRRSVR